MNLSVLFAIYQFYVCLTDVLASVEMVHLDAYTHTHTHQSVAMDIARNVCRQVDRYK